MADFRTSRRAPLARGFAAALGPASSAAPASAPGPLVGSCLGPRDLVAWSRASMGCRRWALEAGERWRADLSWGRSAAPLPVVFDLGVNLPWSAVGSLESGGESLQGSLGSAAADASRDDGFSRAADIRFPAFAYTESAGGTELDAGRRQAAALPGCACARGRCGPRCACALRNPAPPPPNLGQASSSLLPLAFECHAACSCSCSASTAASTFRRVRDLGQRRATTEVVNSDANKNHHNAADADDSDACAKNTPSCPYRPSAARHGLPLRVGPCADPRKGWGLSSAWDLRAGQPVCSYGGDLVRTRAAAMAQADRDLDAEGRGSRGAASAACARARGSLAVSLPPPPPSPMNFVLTVVEVFGGGTLRMVTTVDAGARGCAGRFVNHACGDGANLDLVVVREGSLVPTLVFVAKKHIAAGTELTVDYGGRTLGERGHAASISGGIQVEAETAVRAEVVAGAAVCRLGAVACLCATSSCRGFLPFDPCT